MTDIRTKIRKSKQYAFLRRYVFRRDRFTCKLCGQKGFKLEMHHIHRVYDAIKESEIKNYKLILAVRRKTDILHARNNITLCRYCHKLITGYEDIWKSLCKLLISSNSKPENIIKEFNNLELPGFCKRTKRYNKIKEYLEKTYGT